jgi:hypothetical protein
LARPVNVPVHVFIAAGMTSLLVCFAGLWIFRAYEARAMKYL